MVKGVALEVGTDGHPLGEALPYAVWPGWQLIGRSPWSRFSPAALPVVCS